MAILADGGCTRVPALHESVGGETRDVEENGEKAKLFHKVFFYSKPDNTMVSQDHPYPPPAFQWMPITNTEIYIAVAKLRPHKALGLSDIPNIVIMTNKIHTSPIPWTHILSDVCARSIPGEVEDF